ncbi:MAG: DUF4382 domain-containing protein [Desulfobacteraceae bacterium]
MFIIIALTTTSGCSSSSGSGEEEQGEVTISLTDAAGDFVTYAVDVKSITLTRANGSEIETLPVATTVDFTQYVDVTELITAASVPLGAYTKATMVLDYSNADIRVENSMGESVNVTSIRDADGNNVTELEISVYLENQNKLVIAPGLVSHLALDFDLKSSNTVTFVDNGNAQLVVEPILVADIDKECPKVQQVRGLKVVVEEDKGRFFVKLCPFNQNLKGEKHNFGQVMVLSGTETVYEINGEGFVGDDGLAALADVDEDTAVLVKGEMKFNPTRFEASEVYAGTSVPSVESDVIMGSVLSRNGNTLSVNGVVLSQTGQHIRLNDTVVVTLSENTVVKKQQSMETFSIADIAPGQHIWITGSLSNTDSETLALDASSGTARLLFTTLRGHVTADTAESDLNVELGSIDLRKADLFDFAGTGNDVGNDADPDSYEIETGALSTAGFDSGDPIKLYGFVNAYGQAPYDFEATTLVNYVTLPSFLTLKWNPSTTAPFESMTDASLVVDLNAATVHHLISSSHISQDGDEDTITIVPADKSVYVIKMRMSIYVYSSFTEFVGKLDELLDGNNRVSRLFSTGIYEADSGIMTNTYLTIEIR